MTKPVAETFKKDTQLFKVSNCIEGEHQRNIHIAYLGYIIS